MAGFCTYECVVHLNEFSKGVRVKKWWDLLKPQERCVSRTEIQETNPIVAAGIAIEQFISIFEKWKNKQTYIYI